MRIECHAVQKENVQKSNNFMLVQLTQILSYFSKDKRSMEASISGD